MCIPVALRRRTSSRLVHENNHNQMAYQVRSPLLPTHTASSYALQAPVMQPVPAALIMMEEGATLYIFFLHAAPGACKQAAWWAG